MTDKKDEIIEDDIIDDKKDEDIKDEKKDEDIIDDKKDDEKDEDEDVAGQLDAREKALFIKEVALELKENDLEAFADVINVADKAELDAVVKQLKVIVGDIKTKSGYVPKDNLSSNSYDTAKESGDSRSMIKALFNRR